MAEASFIKKTQKQISGRKLELEERVAKSKAMVKVLEELEQPAICSKEKCFLWENNAS